MHILLIFILIFQNTIWVPFSKDPEKPKIEIVTPTQPLKADLGKERCIIIRIKKAPENVKFKWNFIPNSFEVRSQGSETQVVTVYIKGDQKGSYGLYIAARYSLKGNNYCVFDTVDIDFYAK